MSRSSAKRRSTSGNSGIMSAMWRSPMYRRIGIVIVFVVACCLFVWLLNSEKKSSALKRRAPPPSAASSGVGGSADSGYSSVPLEEQVDSEVLARHKNVRWTRDIRPISDAQLRNVGNLIDDVANQEAFNATLDKILVVRQPDTPAHAKVRQYIVSTLQDLKWNVEEHSFSDSTPHGEKKFTNIMATHDPNACHRLVLACHYDSKVMANFVGATDSAVPCAQLVHVAKILDSALKKDSKAPGLTLQLMFFDGEEAFREWTNEDSLYGSRRLADQLQKKRFARATLRESGCTRDDVLSEIDRIEVLVLLDLLGAPNPRFASYFVDTVPVYNRLVDIERRLNKIGSAHALAGSDRTKYFSGKNQFNYVQDDHVPFLKRGVPIVHIIPSPFPAVWHTVSDDRSALHHPTINNLNKIFTSFVAEYLALEV